MGLTDANADALIAGLTQSDKRIESLGDSENRRLQRRERSTAWLSCAQCKQMLVVQWYWCWASIHLAHWAMFPSIIIVVASVRNNLMMVQFFSWKIFVSWWSWSAFFWLVQLAVKEFRKLNTRLTRKSKPLLVSQLIVLERVNESGVC